MKIYEIGTGYTPIPAQLPAATESVIEELVKAFLSMKQPVEIIDISTKSRAKNQLPILEVRVPSFLSKADVGLGSVHKIKRVIYSIALAMKLKKILKASNEKVVLHFHNQYNAYFFVKLVPKKLRARAIMAYTNHNGVWNLPWDDAKSTLKKRYFQEIEAIRKADIIFVLNEKTKENIIVNLHVAGDKIVKVTNGVNTETYVVLSEKENESIKQKYNLSGKKIILQAGSVNENKGQLRTIEFLEPLLKANDDLAFVYVGDVVSKEYFNNLQDEIVRRGLQDKVYYLGAVSPGKEMNELYNMATATIFVSNYEGCPLVCIESLSAGTPVILATNLKFDFGEGTIFCAKEDFNIKYLKCVLSSEECEYLSKKARQNAVNNYSWQKVAEEYLRYLQTMS